MSDDHSVLRRVVPTVLIFLLVTACDVVPLQPTSPAPPPPAPAGPLPDQLAALQIAVEDTGAHYDRDDWLPDWARSGQCNTRETVLRQQGQGVVVNDKCAPTAGQWTSAYDGVTVTDPSKLDRKSVV